MTRFATLHRRVARAQAAGGASAPVPCVITVQGGQTQASAHAAHAHAFPVRPRGFAPLIVPAKPSTDAERQRFADRFKASQMALVAAAKNERTPLITAPRAERAAEQQQLKRVSEVIAAAKTPPTKPTFSASQFNHTILRERIAARRADNQ